MNTCTKQWEISRAGFCHGVENQHKGPNRRANQPAPSSLSPLPANLALHGWITCNESHPSSQQSRYCCYHMAVKSRTATNKSKDKLLRNTHQHDTIQLPSAMGSQRTPVLEKRSKGHSQLRLLNMQTLLMLLSSRYNSLQLCDHHHHTDAPTTWDRVAMKGFTTQILRPRSHLPANPIQNPSYFEKLLRRQEPGCKQSSQAVSCFHPFIDRFDWAAEWWGCYFLQLTKQTFKATDCQGYQIWTALAKEHMQLSEMWLF